VFGAKSCRYNRDFLVDWIDDNLERGDQPPHLSISSSAGRMDECLGKCVRRYAKVIFSVLFQRGSRSPMVTVISVEDCDEHARVEDDQRHSSRSSSSAPADHAPGSAPATRLSVRLRRSPTVSPSDRETITRPR
jgi:hypothetical protein